MVVFSIRVIVQRGDLFDGTIYKKLENVGGIGRDDNGFYMNLRRKLTVQEMIDLLKHLNGLGIDFYQEEIEIAYV